MSWTVDLAICIPKLGTFTTRSRLPKIGGRNDLSCSLHLTVTSFAKYFPIKDIAIVQKYVEQIKIGVLWNIYTTRYYWSLKHKWHNLKTN